MFCGTIPLFIGRCRIVSFTFPNDPFFPFTFFPFSSHLLDLPFSYWSDFITEFLVRSFDSSDCSQRWKFNYLTFTFYTAVLFLLNHFYRYYTVTLVETVVVLSYVFFVYKMRVSSLNSSCSGAFGCCFYRLTASWANTQCLSIFFSFFLVFVVANNAIKHLCTLDSMHTLSNALINAENS